MGLKNSLLLKMAIEIVDFPIKHGDFPMLNYQRVPNKIGDCNLFGGDWNHGFFFYDFPETVGNGMSSSQLTFTPSFFRRGW